MTREDKPPRTPSALVAHGCLRGWGRWHAVSLREVRSVPEDTSRGSSEASRLGLAVPKNQGATCGRVNLTVRQPRPRPPGRGRFLGRAEEEKMQAVQLTPDL